MISSRSASCTGETCSTRSSAASDPQQFAVAVERGPGRERDEGRLQRQTDGAHAADRLFKIAPGVVLFELGQHRVIQRFDGAGDEQASGVFERAAAGRDA